MGYIERVRQQAREAEARQLEAQGRLLTNNSSANREQAEYWRGVAAGLRQAADMAERDE
jgi:hypothetical protein